MRLSAILIASLLLLGSCNQSKKRLIGVVPKATSHVFWVAVEKGAKAAAKEFQVDIEWNGAPSETEYARQIQIVDSMINRHVDGLAVAATERRALVASVDRAMKQGIPVTIFDSGIEGENYTSYVATNNYEGGQLGARALAKLIGVEDRVWVQVEGQPRVHAIADEDLDRENDDKTSAVHFLRFELSPAMKQGLKGDAALAMGIDHPNYSVAVEKAAVATTAALLGDLVF